MFINEENNVIMIGNKELKLSEVLDKLSGLSGRQVADFFLNRENKLPREINVLAIRSVLNEQVKISKQLSLTDEMRYRLLSYPHFSEYQLQNFMSTLANPTLYQSYVRNLWRLILLNDDILKIAESEYNYLLVLPQTQTSNDFNVFQIQLGEVEYDYDGYFDGIEEDEFETSLTKSSTLTELREIGAKYNLNIPRRLKREELEEMICERLEDDGKLDDDTKNKLHGMSVLMLQRFAKTNGIKLSVELKKDELVDFVLRAAKKANLPHQKKKGTVQQLPENEFEFKEEMVRDIIVPTKPQPKPVEPVVVERVVEQPIQVGIAEDQVLELIKKTVQEMLAEQPQAISEEKVCELINSKILSVPAEGGISEEQLDQIIDTKLQSVQTPQLTKEEVVELINQNPSISKEEVESMISNHPSISKEDVVAIVKENQVEPTVTVAPEEVKQIVDEKLKDFNPQAEQISKAEIEKIVLSNLDKINIPQPQPVDYQLVGEIIRTTINEVVQSNVPNKLVVEEKYIDEPVTMMNPLYEPDYHYNSQEIVPQYKKVEEEPVLSKRKQKKADKKKRKQDKKNKKKKAKQNAKDFNRIVKRGVENTDDIQLVQQYQANMQAKEIKKMTKRKRRTRRFLTFLGILLLLVVVFYAIFFVDTVKPGIPVISHITGFFDANVKVVSDFMDKITKPVAEFVGLIEKAE